VFSLFTVIVSTLVALLAGCLIGYLLARTGSGQARNADIEKRLIEAEDALHNYQRDVTEHFARTTELVNSLNASYRDMHEHLAGSALALSTPEISKQLLNDAEQQLPGTTTSTLREQQVQPPRDWAPKRQGHTPTLSESYGLEQPDEPTETLATEPADKA
jgi:uncharacterized membrane-anchored protein YhcB (DUF1043 family)